LSSEEGVLSVGFPLTLQKYGVVKLYFFAVFDGGAFMGQVKIPVAYWSESFADSFTQSDNLICFIDVIFGQFKHFLCEVRLAAVLFY
jgi:hypothetical protein